MAFDRRAYDHQRYLDNRDEILERQKSRDRREYYRAYHERHKSDPAYLERKRRTAREHKRRKYGYQPRSQPWPTTTHSSSAKSSSRTAKRPERPSPPAPGPLAGFSTVFSSSSTPSSKTSTPGSASPSPTPKTTRRTATSASSSAPTRTAERSAASPTPAIAAPPKPKWIPTPVSQWERGLDKVAAE